VKTKHTTAIQRWASIFFCFILTASCTEQAAQLQKAADDRKIGMIDPELGLNREDYRNPYAPKGGNPNTPIPPVEPPVPDMAEVLAAPHAPKLGETKLVSIAVTDDVPLKDVFIELARMADVDIEVDSGITGGVSFRAKDRPFNEVVDRLADMAGLRYTAKNGVLRIERDTPYIQDYAINFLNLDRTSNGSYNLSSTGSNSGGGGGGSSGSSGTTSGSSSAVTSKSDSDFWKQFEAGIKQILTYKETTRVSATSISKQPDAPSADATEDNSAKLETSAGDGSKPFYIINRQASTLTVSGTDKQQDMVKRFLRMMESNISSQVLIEAEILEVDLNDTYQSGVDWTKFGNDQVGFSGNLSNVSIPATGSPIQGAPSITFLSNNIFGTGTSLSAAASFLDEFGTTRALSSPRLHAMNNQQAVLSFAEGIVYFHVQISTTNAVLGTGGGVGGSSVVTPAQVTVTSTQQTAPVGISMVIQPVIDAKNNEITLDIHPTLTSLIDRVDDPGFEISKATAIAQLTSAGGTADSALTGATSKIPEIETREMDSIVKIKSGQALVIGGLIQNQANNTDAGVPGAENLPLVGRLFQGVNKSNQKQELVIFLRATIVQPGSVPEQKDQTLYNKFTADPRPLGHSQ